MSATETVTRITAENVATIFPDVDTSLAHEIFPTASTTAAREGNELEGYDEEQVRLMDEVCIVLDDDDKPIGSASKKTCTSPLFFSQKNIEHWLIECRPHNGKHQPRPPPPRLLRLPLRLQQASPPATARRRENHIPQHVDKHLLLASAGHSRGDRRRAGRGYSGREARGAAQVGAGVGDSAGAGAVGEV